MNRPALTALQEWMQAVVTHRQGTRAALEDPQVRGLWDVGIDNLADHLPRSRDLDAVDRLSIYGNMIRLRFLESMEEDYPGVQRALGADSFRDQVVAYLDACPSRSYTLHHLGARFAGYLDSRQDLPERAFLVELATLERAWLDVFDAPHAEPVTADEILAVPAERWAELRLTLIPALALFAFEYPVLDYLLGEQPAIPAAQPTWAMVHRRLDEVVRSPLSAEQYALLVGLQSGLPLAQALESALEQPDADAAAIIQALGTWFQNWGTGGVFARVVGD